MAMCLSLILLYLRAQPYSNTGKADSEAHDEEHASVEHPDEPLDTTIPHQAIVEDNERDPRKRRSLYKEELCTIGHDASILVPVAEQQMSASA